MQLEVQKFQRPPGSKDEDSAYRPAGPAQTSEYGLGDAVDQALTSTGYLANWSPDFIQKAGLKPFSRFYHSLQMAVDLDVLPSMKDLLRDRRRLCYQLGFGYLAIPVGLKSDPGAVSALYNAALEHYYAYEAKFPRPHPMQEMIITDNNGNVRKAMVPVTLVKVGGQIICGSEEQARALNDARPTTSEERQREKEKAAAFLRFQECRKTGEIFRNPFRKDGSRHLPVKYAA